MSAKPTGSLAMTHLWASSGAITVPSGAKQDLGFVVAEAPPAQYFNFAFNRVDNWLKYLSDGDLTINSLAVATTLAVDGNVTLGNNAAVDTVTVNADVTFAAGADLTVGTGATALGGTLGVTGAATVGGTLGVTGASTQAAITASGLITANAGVTAGVNQSVTVSGTGKIKHGTRSISHAPRPTQIITISGTAPADPGSGLPGASLAASSQYRIPVPIPDTSCTIRSVLISDRLSGASFTTFIEKYNNSSGTTYTTVTTTGGSGTGVVTSTITGGVQLIQQETLWIELLAPAGGLHITNVCCTYDSV